MQRYVRHANWHVLDSDIVLHLSATAMQQRCNRGATAVQQRCNSGATAKMQNRWETALSDSLHATFDQANLDP